MRQSQRRRQEHGSAPRSSPNTHLGMANLPDYADKFMNLWKAAVLLRPGFAFRVGLSDEVLGATLRDGLTPYLMARVAAKRSFIESNKEGFLSRIAEQ